MHALRIPSPWVSEHFCLFVKRRKSLSQKRKFYFGALVPVPVLQNENFPLLYKSYISFDRAYNTKTDPQLRMLIGTHGAVFTLQQKRYLVWRCIQIEYQLQTHSVSCVHGAVCTWHAVINDCCHNSIKQLNRSMAQSSTLPQRA